MHNSKQLLLINILFLNKSIKKKKKKEKKNKLNISNKI